MITSVTPHQAYTDTPVVLLVNATGWRPRLNIEVGSGNLATDLGSLQVHLVPDSPDGRPTVPLEIVKWDGQTKTWARIPSGLADGSYALELVDSSGGKTSLPDGFEALGPDLAPPDIHIESPLPDSFVGAGMTFSARVMVDDHLGRLRQVDWQTRDGIAGNCLPPPEDFTVAPPSSRICDLNIPAPELSNQDPAVTPFSFSVSATDVAGNQSALEISLHLAKLPTIVSFSNIVGALGGYQPFTVKGHNFLPGTKALIGGVPIAGSAPGGNVANEQSIVGWTPPHNRAESVAVDVVSPAGSAQRSSLPFVYALPPRPRDIQPTVGPTKGGILVTVTGNDLRDGVTVYVGLTLDDRRPLFAPTFDSTQNKVVGCLPPGTGTVSGLDIRSHHGRWPTAKGVHVPGAGPRNRAIAHRSALPNDAAMKIQPRLLAKLTLLALGISSIPLAIEGYSSYRIGQAAVRAAADEGELQMARQVAEHVSTEIDHLIDTLRVDSRVFDLTRTGDEAPTAQGVAKFLQLVYHQSDSFCAVALFDERAELIGQPAYLESPDKYDSFKGHEPMRPSDVETLGLMAPLGDALGRGAGVGPVFIGGPARTPHVVIAVAFTQTVAGARRVLTAEVALRGLAAYVEALSTADTEVKLVDGRGRLIAITRANQNGGLLAPQKLPGAHEGDMPLAENIDEYVTAEKQRLERAAGSAR